jgi:hypothetical protein
MELHLICFTLTNGKPINLNTISKNTMKKKEIREILQITRAELERVRAEKKALANENFELAKQNEFLINRSNGKY